MGFKNFIKQCREHDLFKMLSIYIVSSWVLLQVLSVTREPLGLPQKSVTFLIIILLVALPFYLLIVWKIKILQLENITPVDENDQEQHLAALTSNKEFKKYFLIVSMVITVICAFVTFLIIRTNFTTTPRPEVTYLETDRIAVLKFGNNTGNSKYDDVGKMASDWILHGITENKLGQVISTDVIEQYNTIFANQGSTLNNGTAINANLKPARIVTGNYYLKNGQLVFQATLIDGKTNKTIYSFKAVDCVESNPLACIEALEATISGFLATEGKKKLMLQETPPNFEAYQMVLQSSLMNNDENYLQVLEKAISLDRNYFEPKILRVAYFYNTDNFKVADSLLRQLKSDNINNTRQINLINLYDALLKGDNKKVYQTNFKEFMNAPFDITSNATTMTIALQFVNKPERVDEIYKQIENDPANVASCFACISRLYIKSLADIELKKYNEAKALLQNASVESTPELLRKPYISALIRNGEDDLVKEYLIKLSATESEEVYTGYAFFTAFEYLLKDDFKKSEQYFKQVLKANLNNARESAFASLYLEDYTNAQTKFAAYIRDNPKDFSAHAALAIALYKNNDVLGAQSIIKNIEDLREPFQFGEIDYSLAQYFAVIKDSDSMYYHLLKAVGSGKRFVLHSYTNDVFFKEYKGTKRFKEVTQFWH